ncbi:hypothetical protein SteCoe_23741 [Stentor coeruleus]|uniref:Tubulin--tyrosine ligase-like protein 9 n=1 Tax=Stentor coeruleus TaxID=5963 RepID=A0A1R2BJL9_9CILI|nr:hypothetical protein SteCoe_23741 [Stentor coeruleus]
MELKQSSRFFKIICNVSSTKYEIVRHAAKKILGWKLSYDEDTDEWDVFWTDTAVQPEKLAKMKHYQRINHFPGMYLISRKNYLAFNLGKLKRIFPDSYNFYPRTWVIPCDLGDLKSFMSSKKNPYVIVKPEASCQGRGIYITKRIEDINPDEKHVVQEYLTKPFLIDNLKFDLRIYVLVTSCDPLRIFIHEDGLTRFATEEYEKPNSTNIEDMCMHLTNYAINKNNPNFIQNEDPECDDVGHKRSLKSTYDFIQNEGYDVERLKGRIDDMIIKTLCAVQPNLCHHYRSCQADDYSRAMCFEILGFDVIIDKKLNPYVLEVNHTPSFSTDSPLDRTIKKTVISQALELVNVSTRNRKKYFKKQKEDIQKRSMTGKMERLTIEERKLLISSLNSKRNKYEMKHCGGYRKIYPTENDEYNKYIEASDNLWQEWTGAKIVRSRRLETKSPVPRPIRPATNNTQKPKSQVIVKVPSKAESYMERPSSTIFERLSQPVIRKYRSTTVNCLPGIIYEEKKDQKKDMPIMINPCIEYDKPIIKPRVYSEIKASPANRPIAQRHIGLTLKEILSGRPGTSSKSRYLNFALGSK